MPVLKVCSDSTLFSHGYVTVASPMFQNTKENCTLNKQILLAVDTAPLTSVSNLQVSGIFPVYITENSHIFLSSQVICQLSIINTLQLYLETKLRES